MKSFWTIIGSLLIFTSCNKQKEFTPGTYFLYDLLDDTAFFAIENLHNNGEGVFKELNLYEGDICQVAEIKFEWKVIKNHLIYNNQKHTTIKDCSEKQSTVSTPSQVYTILEKGEDYFIGKTYYENELAPVDSSIVIWKKQ